MDSYNSLKGSVQEIVARPPCCMVGNYILEMSRINVKSLVTSCWIKKLKCLD